MTNPAGAPASELVEKDRGVALIGKLMQMAQEKMATHLEIKDDKIVDAQPASHAIARAAISIVVEECAKVAENCALAYPDGGGGSKQDAISEARIDIAASIRALNSGEG